MPRKFDGTWTAECFNTRFLSASTAVCGIQREVKKKNKNYSPVYMYIYYETYIMVEIYNMKIWLHIIRCPYLTQVASSSSW